MGYACKLNNSNISIIIIKGTLLLHVYGYNNAGAQMMHVQKSSNITIEIDALSKQYTISGNTVTTSGSWTGTSYPVAKGICTFTITSIDFKNK